MGKRIDLTGQTFGKLTVVGPSSKRKTPSRDILLWECSCECGGKKITDGSSLKRGNTSSCGCARRKKKSSIRTDLTGQKFGMLTVIGISEKRQPSNPHKSMWDCICECGGKTTTEAWNLKNGRTISCGCQRYPQSENRVSRKGKLSSLHQKSRSNTGIKGITRLKNGVFFVQVRAIGKTVAIGRFNSLADAKRQLIAAENKFLKERMAASGKTQQICEYHLCNATFTRNPRAKEQLYCSDLCRSKAYRKRRIEQNEGKRCPQCGHAWIEPQPNKKGKLPRYCLKCQDYFKSRYSSKKNAVQMHVGFSRRIDLVGQIFGDLKVIQLSDKRGKYNVLLWECLCTCGETTYVPGGSLRAGTYKSCGCKRVANRDAGAKEHITADSVDGTRKSALKAKLHKGNKSGHKGVIWSESRQRYRAYIGIRGKSITLGYYVSLEDAVAARAAAEEQYHKPYLE
jgi:hypothetical protein